MLEVNHLFKTYHGGFWNNRQVHAVNDVSFRIREGEIFGIMGESGCGKTTTAKMITGLIPATSGEVLFEGQNILKLTQRQWKPLRRDIQIIFQHPQMTFNPRATVYSACREPIRVYHLASNKREEEEMIVSILERVGIAADQMHKYPHEISGGQAQRVSIARTLLLKPKLLICDEPTSMLDISVQAQIKSILKQINREEHLAMLYISHNLDVIHAMCDEVAVMRKGQILEQGNTAAVFGNPRNEYTKKLLSSRI